MFAKLSIKFRDVKFLKIDIDVTPELAERFGINSKGMFVQFPYLIQLQKGSVVKRYPPTDKKGNVLEVKFYKLKEIARYFGLEVKEQ